MTDPDVCVVGSANLDTTVAVDALPQPGETVLGTDATHAIGGKGLNQAIACARLGRRVALLACVGRDDAGARIEAGLASEGIDVTTLVRRHAASGRAFVLISPDDNTIVVSPGANGLLSPADVRAAGPTVAAAAAVVAQLEIPLETVLEAATACSGLFVLNPAPAREVTRDLLDRVDVLVPNAGELARLVGAATPRTVDDAAALAHRLRPDLRVVVTLGGLGAVVIANDVVTPVPAVDVRVVDTTAAGDTFCAALCDALIGGAELEDAARWAVRAAGLTVGRHGAAGATPTRAEVLLGQQAPT